MSGFLLSSFILNYLDFSMVKDWHICYNYYQKVFLIHTLQDNVQFTKSISIK